MKNYYSIIKIAPNPTAGDSLSIGLLLYDKNGFRIKFSDNKKKAAKSLLYEKGKIVDFVVKQIEQRIIEDNIQLSNIDNKLFDSTLFINSDYIKYLSKYSNGILQFSNHTLLSNESTETDFIKLFEILVDSQQEKIKNVYDAEEFEFKNIINKKLIDVVKDKVNTNIDIEKKNNPVLNFSF